jgi:DNA processing protein
MHISKDSIWYWLALRAVPRLAVHKKISLVDKIGLEALFESDETSLVELGLNASQRAALLTPDIKKIDNILASLDNCCDLITYQDGAYPSLLKEIYDPPLVLFYQGNINLLNEQQVAIVGSRFSSAQGREVASTFAHDLTRQGLTITSGLALGIDAAAHMGALTGCGNTIAVVATGLDRVYPARNRSLAKQILEQKGLIISEFNPGVAPRPGNFPKRNRIISGLSLGVAVVEAAVKSGSLITARCALEQNREVFAVPGSIHNPNAKGCHHLIQQGAKLIESAVDIINELDFPTLSGRIYDEQENVENNCQQDLFLDPLLASVGYEITPVDIVVSRSKLPTDEVLTRLTLLELRGLVSAVPGGYLRLN